MTDATGATAVTFEEGYEELKGIVTRLDAEDVSVHEMCELFARGKGLEQALRGYLETQQGRLDEIEAGENLPEFVIVAPSTPANGDEVPGAGERSGFAPDFEDDRDFKPAGPPRQSTVADDDIPF